MLATDLRSALDPAAFAETSLGLALDPWQREVLTARSRQLIMVCSRQAGKSTIAALLALHTVLFQPGALVLLLSPSLRQSRELFLKALDAYGASGRSVPADVETRLSLTLTNGSRLVSLPGKESTIRGFSGASLLVIDEAARVPDELYYAVRPMLAVSGGRIMLLSTPFGRRGFFYEESANGGAGWERVRVTGDQCPRIPSAFLERERAAMGTWRYDQEYACKFADSVSQLFGHDDIMEALDPTVAPLFP